MQAHHEHEEGGTEQQRRREQQRDAERRARALRPALRPEQAGPFEELKHDVDDAEESAGEGGRVAELLRSRRGARYVWRIT
jgi:hypothetical protein